MFYKLLKNKSIRIAFIVLTTLFILFASAFYYYFNLFKKPNITLNKKEFFLCIPSNADYAKVEYLLKQANIIKDFASFQRVAHLKNYPERVHPGRYRIVEGMNNDALINILRSGNQYPSKVTFNNIRTKEQLAGALSRYFESDSLTLLTYINQPQNFSQWGFNNNTFLALPIPNSYQIYWNSTPEQIFKRLFAENNRFWNAQRLEKAKNLNLTPIEVAILASIVDEETIKNDEKPIVAGLYLNRLKRRMLLQADPTVKYALGNFAIKRLLLKDLTIDSPYNTYLYAGLPPGPIRVASIQGIDAVLNHKSHNYIYMCAKDDFSGYHNFATNLSEHNRNASKYQHALNKLKISR